MNQTVTIRIPNELKRELHRISREEHIPLSDIVRDSLRKYVARRRFRKLRETVLPFAEAQGYLTDEDIFKEFS